MAQNIQASFFHVATEAPTGLVRVVFRLKRSRVVVASNWDCLSESGRKNIDAFTLVAAIHVYFDSTTVVELLLSLSSLSFFLNSLLQSILMVPGNRFSHAGSNYY